MPIQVPTLAEFRALVARVEALESASPSPTSSLQQLVDEANETLSLTERKITDTAVINKPLTIVGAGPDRTIISAASIDIPNEKAVLVAGANLTLRRLNLTGARVGDNNGAGIRLEPDASLDLKDVRIYGCQTGLLTAPGSGSVTIKRCRFFNNGAGVVPDYDATHEIYIGQIESVVARNSLFDCGAKSTHAFKSRAKSTTIVGCTLSGSEDTTGDVSGSVLDVADGGSLLVEDSDLIVAAGAPNYVFLSYALESTAHGAQTVIFRDVRLHDGSGTGGAILAPDGAGAQLFIEGTCTFTGPTPPRLEGWASVTGQFIPAT